ncbi:Sua5/YciO/YrdC/YwlC family protein [Haladaptatus paucihalophilus DX253]|uniref:L-threonylcarbamoyladenylate synthase n=1 Tax=Haladaptatus paucihalophilus DX253 TaxID=797209 RepID=E7QP41_HALPU|nr:L-threonylcarbamoyladenylate synthase [Haladaptatus paucihalophilus]EFW93694.1 Sua5/YciO/YrdC/YwlC family protein [Haladaptatus paucihalophilus DX253]SHL48130.1 translation factor SUA5 [Haladaptatus paucihalophilus DX253]
MEDASDGNGVSEDELERAATAMRDGHLVVYPTETVYGLGADALDPTAIERVFDAKGRARDKPISLAVPDVETARNYVRPTERELAFMEAFLPGPVTVLCEKRDIVPDVLTGGRSRVGVRIPDQPVALSLLRHVAPITSTSANVSGRGSVTCIDDLDDEIRDAAECVIDGGETGGTGSTVVNVKQGEILRRGENADEIEAWLAAE